MAEFEVNSEPFEARFPSECGRGCEDGIAPGAVIVGARQTIPEDEGGGWVQTWVHEDCARPEPRTPVICAGCHMVRPCDCDDIAPEWTL